MFGLGSEDSLLLVGFGLGLALGLYLYFLPAWMAFRRGHRNKVAILVLNMLLGWTFLGWVGALVWAATDPN